MIHPASISPGRIAWTVSVVHALLLLCSGSASADTTGIIGGVVSDVDGNPLIGATVMILDTSFGTMTDSNGEYIISGLPPGEYSLVVRMVGRATSIMEGIVVVADRLNRIDIQLEEDPTGTTVITVEASRRTTLQDVPTTIHMLDLPNAESSSSMSIVDIVARQPGVVSSDGELHVRGGRTGEVDYKLDGVSLRSPITNTFNLELPLGAVSNAMLMTGGLGVEYGNSMSGVVNIVGKEGGNSLEGSMILRYGDISVTSNDFGERLFMEETDNSQCRSNLTGLEASLSGPEPLTGKLLPQIGIRIPGEMSFSVSGQISVSGRDTLDTRDRWENSWQSDMSGLAKITYRPVTRTSFSLTAIGSYRERGWNEWSWSHYHLPAYIEDEVYLGRSQDHVLPVRFNEGTGLIFNTTQLFGSETCLKLTLGFTEFLDWHRIREVGGGYVGEDSNPVFWLTQYTPEERVADSLGFYHTGIHPNVWFDSKANVSSVRLDLDSSPNTRIRLKAGLSAEYFDLYQYNIYAEQFGNVFVSQWEAYPYSGSAYLQGSYRFSGGVISTGGFRADMFDANTSFFDEEAGETRDTERKWNFSPRVGISVPFGENSVFFTTYGHHFQMPSMECLYVETSYNLAQGKIVAGNPSLDPEVTESFEVGIRYFIDRFTEMSLAAYYKDITGLVSTADHSEGTYYIFTNDDSHGTVRGIEATIDRNTSVGLSGQLSYSFSVAKGRYSSMLERYNYSQMGVVYVSNEDNYLDWDQTHTAGASIRFATSETDGPEIGGLHPLENTTIGLKWEFGSGIPYTLPPSSGELVTTNTERYPFSMQTDLTFSRRFIAGPVELEFSFGIFNLFNRHNIVHIYDTSYFNSTGLPGGEQDNARAWSPARHFILAAGLSW